MNRREFLVLSALSSAAIVLGDKAWATGATPKYFGAFEELPAGAVQPQGWLRAYLQKQAAGLGSQLPLVSWPFTEPYWKGETQGESWWPWEQTAYWVDGATRLALVLGDKALLSQVGETLDYTLSHIDADGYIGPAFFKDPKPNFHRWPTMIFFRGLEAKSDAQGAKRVIEDIRRHYVEDKAQYGTPTRNVTNIEPMLWCYRHTGDKRLLDMAEKAWAEYLTVAGDPEHGDLSRERVSEGGPINAHGVTHMETAKLPAILYAHTGKKEYLDFALAAQKRVFIHHMLVDGIPSTSEWYRGTTSLDSHETCCITDHTWSWGHILAATGDGAWGDHVERAVFNAGAGAIKNDWKAVQYFSCPNQVLATLNSDHNPMATGGRMMAFQPNPGQHTACCGGNIHRLLPNYAIRMWMKGRDDALAATLYGPCTLKTRVKGQPVTIQQTTDYPFGEQIQLRIATGSPVEFPLMLRIPAWCANPSITVNGDFVPLRQKNGFATLLRTFRDNDVVVLSFPMSLRTSESSDGGLAVEMGPLVFSLPIEAKWEAVVENRYTTADYPSWNATPASSWNYAIDPSAGFKLERRKMTDDPWSEPPLVLQIQAKKVEGWDLRSDAKNPNQKFTPPLPKIEEGRLGSAEELTLVPYGCTHLRLTHFPKVPKA